MLGYWNEPEKTAQAIDAAGWMHTGDLATMADDGYVNISGRIKDMVIRGGENVYPREVEEFLYTHPHIADVAVIGVPDEKYGEELMAWVILREGAPVLTADEVRAFCKGQLAHYKVPRYVHVDGRFPDDGDGQDPEGRDAGEGRGDPRARRGGEGEARMTWANLGHIHGSPFLEAPSSVRKNTHKAARETVARRMHSLRSMKTVWVHALPRSIRFCAAACMITLVCCGGSTASVGSVQQRYTRRTRRPPAERRRRAAAFEPRRAVRARLPLRAGRRPAACDVLGYRLAVSRCRQRGLHLLG